MDKARWTPDVMERRQGPLPLIAKLRSIGVAFQTQLIAVGLICPTRI
jgi:hypothetical protein